MYHLSSEQKTIPLWVNKPVWKLFLESDHEFDQRYLHKSINERPNDFEKNLCSAISRRTSTPTEKTKTYGKLKYETVTTKAVMTHPQMEHEKKSK